MPATQPSPPPARVHPSQPITCDTFSPPLSQLSFLSASSLAGAWVQQLLAPCTCSWDWKRWGFFLPAPVQKVPGETLPGPNSECPFSGTVSSFFCVVIPALWPGGQQRHQESLLGEYARWTQKKAFIQACLSFEPKQIISFIHLFTQPSNHPSIRPSVRPPTHPLTHPSIHTPTNLVIEHLFIKHLHVQGSVVSEVDIAVHKIQLLPPRVDRPVGRRRDRCISYKNAVTKPRSRAWGTLVKGAYPRGWEEVMGRSRGWWVWRRTCGSQASLGHQWDGVRLAQMHVQQGSTGTVPSRSCLELSGHKPPSFPQPLLARKTPAVSSGHLAFPSRGSPGDQAPENPPLASAVMGFGSHLSLRCVTLGKSLNHFGPQFPHL